MFGVLVKNDYSDNNHEQICFVFSSADEKEKAFHRTPCGADWTSGGAFFAQLAGEVSNQIVFPCDQWLPFLLKISLQPWQ
jgi:hypothetical protein